MMTQESRLAILKQILTGKVYDLSVDLYVGMPSSCAALGDPRYHIWMTHLSVRPERGVSLIEVFWLEDLAKDQVYEFVLIAAPLKLRGATGSPVRPIAIPIQR